MRILKGFLKVFREKERPAAKTTLSQIRALVFLENLVCVNRNYLINNRNLRKIGNFVFYLPIFTIIWAFITDVFVLKVEMKFFARVAQFLMFLQIVILSNNGKKTNTFNAIDRLDESYEMDECAKVMKRKAVVTTVFSCGSLIINLYTTKAFDVNIDPLGAVLYTILTIIYDMEMDFMRVLIEGFNLRLKQLKNVPPQRGSKIYSHILLAAAHMGEEYNFRILLMLFFILVKTVYFASQFLILKSEMSWVVLILWRQLKSLISLWALCLAASNSANICRCLALHIGQRLVLEPRLQKEANPKLHKLTYRWYLSVLREKPMYMSNTLPSLDLNIPLGLLDVCVNYLLIIVQIYSANNK